MQLLNYTITVEQESIVQAEKSFNTKDTSCTEKNVSLLACLFRSLTLLFCIYI